MIPLVLRRVDESSSLPINIPNVEQYYGAKFVGDFCIKAKGGGWTDFPVAIFYQPNPKTELGHSHYFGIHVNFEGVPFITSGDNAFSEGLTGVAADNGEVIISRWRHNFVTSYDGSVYIDGGRDYTKYGCYSAGPSDRLVDIKVVDGKLVIDEASIHENLKQHLGQ